jgi:outer membrane protein TolC
LTDFLNVLDAQRQQYEIEEEVIVAQQAAAVEFVIFYKSLGGGWERYEGLPPIPACAVARGDRLKTWLACVED